MVAGETVQQDLIFDNKEQSVEWMQEVMRIKSMCAFLVQERTRPSLQSTNEHELFGPWLEMVEAFRVKWGAEYMAKDVVFAEEDFRKFLGKN